MVTASTDNITRPLLHICCAHADHAWVHGRMVRELGLESEQYRTRADDGLGELQLAAIEQAVRECRFTVLVASTAARWNKLAQFAAALAQQAGVEDDAPRLIIIARDFALDSEAARMQLSLGQRALVALDCSDEGHTVESMVRLRKLLMLDPPIDVPPACPYPGLARFTTANRDLLFGRDGDRNALLQRIRAGHTRVLIVGPSGSGKSSLVHAAVLPELPPDGYLVHVVPRGGDLSIAVRGAIDALEVPDLGAAFDQYLVSASSSTDAQIEAARATLRAIPAPDPRRRLVVIDPLEEIFAEGDVGARGVLFALLGGLWSLPWCTVILCMRADFYGEVMAERCWREFESCQYLVAPLDDTGLRAAITEPARSAGVHVDAALVERLIGEVDRDRSSAPLPLLQVALKELWTHLRWRYLTSTDYERIVNHQQRGLAAVLAVHAEAVLQRLTGPGDRAVAQRVLLDLVHLGEGRPHTRRRRTLADLRRSGDAPDQLERVVETLIEGRLLTTGDGGSVLPCGDPRARETVHDAQLTGGAESAMARRDRHVDLAHDALITGWPALADWITEHRDHLRTQRRLEARAAAGALLDSDELPEFMRWVAWIASPAGQAVGASEALLALVRRSVAARRLRRRLAGAGLVTVTGAAALFVFLFLQLREEKAKTQASIHEAANVARENVSDLDAKLEPMNCAGAAQVRNDLLTRANELLVELGKLSPLNDDEQRIGMQAKLSLGDLARERGQFDEAQRRYREALRDAQQRADRAPDDAAWQRTVSLSHIRLGELAMAAGKLDDARAWFQQARAIRETLAAADPSDLQWQADLSRSYGMLGEVAVATGHPEDARVWFDKGLAIRKRLAAGGHCNTDCQSDLSAFYDRLGDLALSAGRLPEARARFGDALQVVNDLASAEPSNKVWQRGLVVHDNKLGDVAMIAGQGNDAATWFEKALAITRSLAANDPGNTEWQRDLSVSYEKLGDAAESAGKHDDARVWFDQAVAVRERLAAKDGSNAGWRFDLCTSLAKRAQLSLRAHTPDEATRYVDEARAVYLELKRAGAFQADPAFAQLGRNLDELSSEIESADRGRSRAPARLTPGAAPSR